MYLETTLCVKCPVSYVTCHMSLVMCHISHFFSHTVVELVSGVSVINRAFPV